MADIPHPSSPIIIQANRDNNDTTTTTSTYNEGQPLTQPDPAPASEVDNGDNSGGTTVPSHSSSVDNLVNPSHRQLDSRLLTTQPHQDGRAVHPEGEEEEEALGRLSIEWGGGDE